MGNPLQLVVGVDGSPASDAALRWALEAAGRRGGSVVAVRVWQWDVGSLGVVVPDAPAAIAVAARHAVETQLEKALADRPAGAPAVAARARTAEGDASTALVAAAGDGALLVVGRHGHGAWQRRLAGQTLGSVVSGCLSRSRVPVAVVPPDVHGSPLRVVAGVDGSASSADALCWGADHAAALGIPVVAALAWQLTSLPPPPSTRVDWSVPPLSDWEDVARALLAETVAGALGADQAVRVDHVLLHKPPVAGLLGTVTPSDLLVLGARGRGGFARLLLGSVSRQCVEHAPCPVVVVPSRQRHRPTS